MGPIIQIICYYDKSRHWVFLGPIFYNTSLVSIKFTILLLTARTFPLPSIRISSKIIGGVVGCWGLAMVLAKIFACHPIHYSWMTGIKDSQVKSNCLPLKSVRVAQSVANLTTDAVMLALPIWPIWRLKLDKSKKISVSVVFGLGWLATIIGIVRVIILLQTNNLDLTTLFSNLEMTTGLFAACLPGFAGIRNLLRRKREASNSASRYGYSTGSRPSLWSQGRSGSDTMTLAKALHSDVKESAVSTPQDEKTMYMAAPSNRDTLWRLEGRSAVPGKMRDMV